MCLPYKHVDLNSVPRAHIHKKTAAAGTGIQAIPVLGRQGQGSPEAHGPHNLGYWASTSPKKDLVSTKRLMAPEE